MFYAIDSDGKILPFEAVKCENRTVLTLKKECFLNAEKLVMLTDLTWADAGEDGFYIVPRFANMTADIYTEFKERDDCEYTVELPIMACCAVKTPRFCGLIRFERNYRLSFYLAVKNQRYTLGVAADFTQEERVYDDIRLELIELPNAKTPGDFAKAERELRLSRGEITTLQEKCKREVVEYARKYPLLRIRMAWKQSPSPFKHQTEENEPLLHTAVTFARVRDIADALYDAGVEGIDLQLVGWNKSGHDGRFPQLFPVEEELGGETELRKTIEYVKKRGYRISLHTNLVDSYELANCFSWDNVCVTRDGDYLQRGDYGGGLPYIVCPHKQYETNQWQIPQVKELGVNGMHFTDVLSVLPVDVCYSDAHPCNTADGIQTAIRIMQETTDQLGAFSSEGAMDFSLPALDYALYVCFGDAFGVTHVPMRDAFLPFYELTYHGILLYNPMSATVNFTIKEPNDHLCFILRGGRPSFYIYSKFKTNVANWMGQTDLLCDSNESLRRTADAIARGMEEYRTLADRQFVFLKEYELNENGVEAAIYEDDVIIAGNFSDAPQTYRGHIIPAGAYTIIK